MKSKILQANKELSQHEARYYDMIHSEIFNKKEQARIDKFLKVAVSKIKSRRIGPGKKQALDVGCGTGNLTLRLLKMGFYVTAVDLGQEYLDILKKKYKGKHLKIICKNIDDVEFNQKFDFICTYSTLHHLPDYLKTIEKLCNLLRKGGILYMDHETADHWWWNRNWITKFYDFSCGALNVFYLRFKGIKRKDLLKFKHCYAMADYHTRQEDHIDHQKILALLKKHMSIISMKSYLLHKTHLWNPFKLIYKWWMETDIILWIARK